MCRQGGRGGVPRRQSRRGPLSGFPSEIFRRGIRFQYRRFASAAPIESKIDGTRNPEDLVGASDAGSSSGLDLDFR